jgi:type 1 glutamine amidotransferase
VYPTAIPLAHAFGEESKKNQVTIWANQFAGVRVFGTTIGHHNETMQTTTYLDLVAKGVLWATNKLDDAGNPAPGYGKR